MKIEWLAEWEVCVPTNGARAIGNIETTKSLYEASDITLTQIRALPQPMEVGYMKWTHSATIRYAKGSPVLFWLGKSKEYENPMLPFAPADAT